MTDRSPAVLFALRVTLVVSAVVLISLGGGLVFATHAIATLYGTAESVAGDNAARTAGAAILALGILACLGAGREARVLGDLVVPVMFVWFLLKSVVAYLAWVNHVFPAPVAMTVLISDVLLSVLYAGFLFWGRGKLRQ